MKKNIAYIIIITTILYGSAIQIDGQFSDWDANSSIVYFEDSISDTDGADLLNLSITNDENFLFIKIKLDREIDLLDEFETPSDIIIQIDADNNFNTGYPVLEPRFTANIYIDNVTDGLRVLNDVAAIFRGITYYMGGKIVPAFDKAQSPIMIFTNSTKGVLVCLEAAGEHSAGCF